MGNESQTPPLSKYIAILTVFIVMGVAGLFTGLLLSEPYEYEQTEAIASDRYRSWVTDLGVGEGMEYTVTVDEGGPVDVFILYDTTHPPPDYLIVVEHVGVMEASGAVESAGRDYYIMVDNTDEVGVDPSGTVVVTVSYASREDVDMRVWNICSVLFIVFPIIIIVALLRMKGIRESLSVSTSFLERATPQAQGEAAPSIKRPKGLDPDRYTVLPESCQVCGARLLLDSINNVTLCPVCGTAGPPKL